MAKKAVKITIPRAQREFVESQASKSGFRSADQYVMALIRRDQSRAAAEEIDALLLSGLDAKPKLEVSAAFWRHVRGEISRRSKRRRTA